MLSLDSFTIQHLINVKFVNHNTTLMKQECVYIVTSCRIMFCIMGNAYIVMRVRITKWLMENAYIVEMRDVQTA